MQIQNIKFRGALWLHDTQNTGNSVFKIRVHADPSQSDLEDRWPCAFEGYYQPAALKADLNTMNPDRIAYGQLRLDDGNILRFWDNSTWQPVYASPSNDNLVIFNGLNFQRISPLTKDLDDNGNEIQQEQYYVPYEHYGKYFTAKNYSDELIYCHPIPEADLAAAKAPKYNGNHSDNTRITLPSDSASYAIKSWVHVNPQCLNNVTKRLEEQKIKTNELYDAIMSIDISTLTPLEAMNELFTLQKKVGELSEN